GTATPPPLPLLLDVIPVTGTPGLVFHASGLAEGGSYVLQSTTNLSSTIWAPETHFVATQPFASFTGFTSNSAQKFYRLLGN
ncbi:MAG TPA: hypothetical protein VN673_01670, partial [Clostridia bacterium]|nr:hypothetical protein [Clostridia bacterium]